MKELRKKNFVEPLQNAEVATQNTKVSFLSEKDETILVLFNKVWYNRLCGESALYTSSRPFNL